MSKQALCLVKSAVFPEGLPDRHDIVDVEDVDRLFFNVGEAKLVDREICETDESLLQLIPYVVLRDVDTREIFVYTRGKEGQEGRLHGKCSIGLGGHIESLPKYSLYDNGLSGLIVSDTLRELNEEVGLMSTYSLEASIYGALDADDFALMTHTGTEVDRVHLAVAFTVFVRKTELGQAEKGVILNGQWKSKEELLRLHENKEIELENWSRMLLTQAGDIL